MEEFTIAGCGRFGDECVIEGAVVTIRDIGKGRYHATITAGGDHARILAAGKIGNRSRRNRPGKPPIRPDD